MRSAIGNSLLMNVVIIIVTTVILLFVSVLSYSKAYRVKNGVIEILEKTGEYSSDDSVKEIKQYLKDVGYQTGKCPNNAENNSTGYKICIEEIEMNDGSKRFKVSTYVEFNFPIVGSINPIKVTGESRTIGTNYNNYD